LSENNVLNQILKRTATLLIREKSVAAAQKQALKKAMLFFDNVDVLEPSTIRWNTLKLQRSNRSYEMLLNVCKLVLEGMLQTTEDGKYKMTAFSDEHMERLYEKFILEYYRQHHPYLKASAAQVKWDLDDNADPVSIRFLPTMQTDIMLRHGDQTLIIDAKYYGHTMQVHHDSYSVHSGNLYQIFTYVKNRAAKGGEVAGMLLYAKTDEEIYPDNEYKMSGNKVTVRTLNLNCDFEDIAAQLNTVVQQHFTL
jgi:5-methylcytosine-specific restriction enzyme subunit McrC